MADELEDEVREATLDLIASKPEGLTRSDLDEMGWFELVEEDAPLAIGVLFESLGRTAAASDALDSAVLVALVDAGAEVSLEDAPAAIYYVPGRHDVGKISAGQASDLDGVVFARADAPATLLAPVAREDGSTTLALLDGSGIAHEQVAGVDPSLGLKRISGASVAVIRDLGPEYASLFGRAARRAISHESIGLARAILDVAVEHVTSRQQFGRAIGTYQAVQHRLTDIEVALGGASAVTELTWEDDSLHAVLTAKSLAANALEVAVRNALQVCGGMGFTEEFPLGRLVRRALFLSPFLGGSPQLAAAVGRTVIAAGKAPRLAGFAA